MSDLEKKPMQPPIGPDGKPMAPPDGKEPPKEMFGDPINT